MYLQWDIVTHFLSHSRKQHKSQHNDTENVLVWTLPSIESPLTACDSFQQGKCGWVSPSQSATGWGALHRGRERNPTANPEADRRALHQEGAQSTARGSACPSPPSQWEQWFRAALTQQAAEALPCHTQGTTLCFYPLHWKSNKINGSVSRGLVAVTQREKFTNAVGLGPQKCYFLALARALPLPSLSLGHAHAAAMLPFTCSPQSCIGCTSVTPLGNAGLPLQAAVQEANAGCDPWGYWPSEDFLPCSWYPAFLAKSSTGADAEAQPKPAVSDTIGAASSVLSKKIILKLLAKLFEALVWQPSPSSASFSQLTSVRFGSLPHC